MSDIVFILGAGASKDAGAPLMKEFMDAAEDVLPHDKDVDLVRKAAGKLQSVQAKTTFDIHNIESIFGAIEMGRLIGRFPGFQEDELPELSNSIHRMIAATLNKTVLCTFEGGTIHPNRLYKHLKYLCSANRDQLGRTASIITFNYDLALDYALTFDRNAVSYCLDGVKPTSLPLLKLHGSLNWGTCPVCKNITVVSEFFKNLYFGRDDKLRLSFDIDRELRKKICHRPECQNAQIDPSPVLVPPTWNKTQHHDQLRNVWRQASIELSEAREIYICGYSMPESDAFFSYLFALGSVGDTRLRKVVISDPDPDVEVRFKKIMGASIPVVYRKAYFHDAVGFIQNDLKIQPPQ